MYSYHLLDSGRFRKLEQIGPFRLVRPSPQAVWLPQMSAEAWQDVDAVFHRFSGGDGKWRIHNSKLPKILPVTIEGIKLNLERTDFGHLGVFAEQSHNWVTIRELCQDRNLKVLNLFAYTGGSTIAAAQGGSEVVHVDASKTSVAWAKNNASLNGLESAPIRWLVDDAQKFVAREIRRGSKYQGIILDPPSFGRGSKNEIWKIEDHLIPLLDSLSQLLADDFSFVLLSSHSPGYTPRAMINNLMQMLGSTKGSYHAEEMVINEKSGKRSLPSGASTLFIRAT